MYSEVDDDRCLSGCTIGNGGSVASVAGTPNYADPSYTGKDYQQFNGQMITIDTSVAYSPPQPVAGGLNLLGPLTADEVIEVPLTVIVGPAALDQPPTIPPLKAGQTALETAENFWKETQEPAYETKATFKLIDVTGDLTTNYVIETSQLKIPTGYDLAQA